MFALIRLPCAQPLTLSGTHLTGMFSTSQRRKNSTPGRDFGVFKTRIALGALLQCICISTFCIRLDSTHGTLIHGIPILPEVKSDTVTLTMNERHKVKTWSHEHRLSVRDGRSPSTQQKRIRKVNTLSWVHFFHCTWPIELLLLTSNQTRLI